MVTLLWFLTSRSASCCGQGNVFAIANQTGVASQAGISVTTPVLTLYNRWEPERPGNLVCQCYLPCSLCSSCSCLCMCWLGCTAGCCYRNTDTAHRNLRWADTEPSSKDLPGSHTTSRSCSNSILGGGLTGAITTAPSIAAMERWYNGALILTPGTNLTLQTSTATVH